MGYLRVSPHSTVPMEGIDVQRDQAAYGQSREKVTRWPWAARPTSSQGQDPFVSAQLDTSLCLSRRFVTTLNTSGAFDHHHAYVL